MNPTLVRVFSAAVALALVISLYLAFGTFGLIAVALLAGIGVSYEYTKLLLWQPTVPSSVSFTFLISCALILSVALMPPNWTPIVLSLGATMASVTMMVTMSNASVELLFQTVSRIFMGLVYCGLLPNVVVWILQEQEGSFWFCLLLAIVFFNDTFAYFVGRAFGTTKMWEIVSPKKTWAGSFGGLAGSIVAAIFIKVLFKGTAGWVPVLLAGVLGGAVGQAGDMFESLLKRVAGVKDSGQIMPGHGGFMDRIDSVLFAAPIIYFLSTI